jgi:hypothetical protein
MKNAETSATAGRSRDLHRMHEVYRTGGQEHGTAPHVVYTDPACPHPGCGARLQAIDFRLEEHGREVHDALVRAWWSDEGFAGRCPRCRGWIHFTIRAKRAVSEEEAAGCLKLPDDWLEKAVVL